MKTWKEGAAAGQNIIKFFDRTCPLDKDELWNLVRGS